MECYAAEIAAIADYDGTTAAGLEVSWQYQWGRQLNTLEILRSKAGLLSRIHDYPGVSAVLRHIEVAESYFERGSGSNDTDLFTDVVYRTNHAFEGILKEAYSVLEGKDAQRTTPSAIEQYLADSSVFKPRVMELFSNYRRQWRNPSTHDYQLFFNEQEAFLSILSVTSFVSILMDQMIEKAAFDAERAATEGKGLEITTGIDGFGSLSLVEQTVQLLLRFADGVKVGLTPDRALTEMEVHGMLRAFLHSVPPTMQVFSEVLVGERLMADFLLGSQEERIVLEIKRSGRPRDREGAIAKMLMYLDAGEMSVGILFEFPTSPTDVMQREERVVQMARVSRRIIIISPRVAKGVNS